MAIIAVVVVITVADLERILLRWHRVWEHVRYIWYTANTEPIRKDQPWKIISPRRYSLVVWTPSVRIQRETLRWSFSFFCPFCIFLSLLLLLHLDPWVVFSRTQALHSQASNRRWRGQGSVCSRKPEISKLQWKNPIRSSYTRSFKFTMKKSYKELTYPVLDRPGPVGPVLLCVVPEQAF